MPFDFKKYDEKCNGLTPEELQREWQHYTRLITGAATSTTVSGLALPLTAGVSSIGVALAAPAIHNARKKRDIVERHLNKYNMTHVTRKRDVLGGVAVSGTIGVVTLGVGTMGADAVAAQGAEHGISAIVENDTAIKVVTHAALDGAGLAVEHAHTSHLKKKEAFKAFQAAGVFQAVTDAKAAEAGYAGPVYDHNNPQGYAASSSNQLYFPPPPPPYTPGLAPPSQANTPIYQIPSNTEPIVYGQTIQPTQYYQYQAPDTKTAMDFAGYQQQPYVPQSYPATYAAVPPPTPSSIQGPTSGVFDMKLVAEALPNSSPTPQISTEQQETSAQDLQHTSSAKNSQAYYTSQLSSPVPRSVGAQAATGSLRDHQFGEYASMEPPPSVSVASPLQTPQSHPHSPPATHWIHGVNTPGETKGYWAIQHQNGPPPSHDTAYVTQQGTVYGQILPTPPASTPGFAWGPQTENQVNQTAVSAPQHGHLAAHPAAYYPPPISQSPGSMHLPGPPTLKQPANANTPYYPASSEARYEPVPIPQAYQTSRPQSQIYPPTPQSLPMTPSRPSNFYTDRNTCYFPPPPTGY